MSRWDETFLRSFSDEAPRDRLGEERLARYSMVFALKARQLGLDARKAGLLAARMLAEIADEVDRLRREEAAA